MAAEGADQPVGPAAFEFLHNTFGEFLAADFILRTVLAEADTVRLLAGNPVLSDALRQRLTSMREAWLACLVHTPLHTRPVILGMLREWGAHRLGAGRSRADLLAALDAIVLAQLRSLLTEVTLPDLCARGRDTPHGAQPILGHLAIYSLNLVLLRTYLSDGSYVLVSSALNFRH
jgi:hypothetical protein